MGRSRMSFDQADTLQYFLEAQPRCDKSDRIRAGAGCGDRNMTAGLKELMEALKSFHYEDVQLPVPSVPVRDAALNDRV